MALNLPPLRENRKLYGGIAAAAAGYVVWRWWAARQTTYPASADTTMDGTVTDVPGGSYGPGNVQYGGADITGDTGTTPTTNAEWTNAAAQLLVNAGWDGMTVQVALGKYLTAQALTSQEEQIVRSAIAVAGSPPVGTHSIIHDTSGAGTSTGVTVPTSAPYGFRNLFVTTSAAETAWKPVPGASGYDLQYGEGFPNPGRASSTAGTTATFYGLKSKRVYRYKVRAKNSKGAGPWSSDQWFRTK